MMRAIKAVHSATDHTSTTPEDLEHQRAAQELFARLVTPSIGIRNDALSVNNIPAEWVSLEHGHDRHHAVLYCHGGGYTWRPAGLCPHPGQQAGTLYRHSTRCRLNTV